MKFTPDEYQNAAINTRAEKALVVAAPGSGKTTVIVNRVLHLMRDRKVQSGNIIVITFTRAAAKNMKDRFQSLWGSDNIPFFGTFHGLCYKLINRHLGKIDIISYNTAYTLLNNALASYMDEVGEDKVKEVLNNISRMKTSLDKEGDFKPSLDRDVFNHCFEAYENYKKAHRLWDFDDMQIEVHRLLQKDNNLLESYRGLFKYILVDEFQDCDDLQIKLLQLLSAKGSIFAVGDEDQSIYTFRGSNPGCMVNFSEMFPGAEKLYLNYNYRSVWNIIDGAKRLIANNRERNQKDIKAYRKKEGNIRVKYVLNEAAEGEDISLTIKNFIKVENDYSKNAVLFRTNQEARAIIDSFIRSKIPFVLLDKEYNFFEHFICRDIISYLKLSIDTKDRESFIRIINKPFRYISKTAIMEVRSHQYVQDAFEILKGYKDIPVFQLKNIDTLKKQVSALNKGSLRSAINSVLQDLGYMDYLRELSSKNKVPFEDYEYIVEEFIQASEEYKTIITFLAHIEEYSREIKENAERNKDKGVVLSTIHGVKGMEFHRVFIINCCEEIIPHKNSIDDNIEEERRLFYVGVTRAIDELYLYIPKLLHGREKSVSRFIKESAFTADNQGEELFKKGDRVHHKTFQDGVVNRADSHTIEIVFAGDVKRTFDLHILITHGLLRKL
ncbi:ATP-dependent helicase [Alloiococcus sp. CFN-8]|uniref:ATP-dependent helicase n=1 Tax=Alloiococcus sp. CFN-8 TaxID=3416081 RepID=UPI003CEDC810